VAIARDLMTTSRLESLVVASGGSLTRVDDPGGLPPAASVDLVLVDWSDRAPDWGRLIAAWRDAAAPTPSVVLFGPHTDLDAHAEARRAGLGPMKARSALPSALPNLLARTARESR
jgi:hypothetical protein